MECRLIKQGLVVHPDGAMTPCCVFTASKVWRETHNINKLSDAGEYFNSAALDALGKQMIDDVFPDECVKCAKCEKASGDSGTSWRLSHGIWTDSDFLLELRFSNLCNYSCYTCFPTSSSKIATDFTKLKIAFSVPEKKWEVDSLHKITHLLDNASHLSFLGGEPLYNKNVLRLLPNLRNKKKVSITTNGSKFVNEISDLSGLLLSYSVDGIGSKNEYIRFGSNWDEVMNNIQQAIDARIETHVVTTVSVYNILHLDQILTYFNELPLNFHYLNIVFDPDFMSVSCLHPALRKEAQEVLDRCDQIAKFSQTKPAVEILKNMLSVPHSIEKWNKLLEYTQQLDSIRQVSMNDALPELNINLGS